MSAAQPWRPFWLSRLLVWCVGCSAVLVAGISTSTQYAFDPAGLTMSFGRLGNVLLAPAVRWDSVWYIDIANRGYHSGADAAFFPLYPILIHGASYVVRSAALAAVIIAMVAAVAALGLIHRLTQLELGSEAARTTVALVAFGPTALFLSAAYTESLFLALSAGTFYAARRSLWAVAGVLGGLAAMTRSTGALLVIPLLILFLYGPRADGPPQRRRPIGVAAAWKPRYPLRPAILWLGLIPLGTALFCGYLQLRGFGALSPLHAESRYWGRDTVEPLSALLTAVSAAGAQLGRIASGAPASPYQSLALFELAIAAVASAGVVACFRRLPLAYGTYAAIALLVAVSSTTHGTALVSIGRYASVIFPIYMVVGGWASRRALGARLVAGSAVVLMFFSAQFATWHWVA